MKEILKKIIVKILTLESRLILQKHKPYIIGVVGAVGKTSTKDSIASIFENKKDENGKEVKYIATKKSLNSEFGVPLTIIAAESGWNSVLAWLKIILKGAIVYLQKDYAKYLVLEVGADQKGDVRSVAKWLRCDIVVVTMYGEVPVHVENFKNREELIREDEYLVKSLKENGKLIYNLDCPDACDVAERCDKDKVSFAITSNADYKSKTLVNDIKKKMTSSQVLAKGKISNLECAGVLGSGVILCALPALAVSDVLSFDTKESLSNIKNMYRQPGRMRVLDGKNGSIIIDDSYNSSPVAAVNGLSTLKTLKASGRKIAILGDMMELGKHAKEEHIKVGNVVAKSADVLLAVGGRSKFTADGAKESGMGEGWILEIANSAEAGEEVLNILKEGDIVYIKGSQSMRMERATKILVADNVDVKKDLPRQDEEWLKR